MTWQTAMMVPGALAVVYVVLVVAVILQIRAWGRQGDEQAARCERRHHGDDGRSRDYQAAR